MLPGNPRYQPRQLQPIFGYDKLFQGVGEVEIAVMQTLGEIGAIPTDVMSDLKPDVIERLLAIPTTLVDQVERTHTPQYGKPTGHDIRAWVRIAQEIVGPRLAPWVHVPLTSYDPLDTGRMLHYRAAYRDVLRHSLQELVINFADLVDRFADQLQIGRTHGQHALPITVGFWLASILNRICVNWKRMDETANGLVGKISGAVGAYNAQVGLGFYGPHMQKPAEVEIPYTFEDLVLRKLGLDPATISTQVLPPENLSSFLFACLQMSAAIAQLGRDCRHLMRSEIGEVAEEFADGQVGSSTMAHKRNPITFENMEGMWLKSRAEFGKVMEIMITDHQRDLVASCIMRDFPVILVNLQQQLNSLLRRKSVDSKAFISRITIDPAACQRNFNTSSRYILAEPIYIALQMAGYDGDAHHFVSHQLMPIAVKEQLSLTEVLRGKAEEDEELLKVLGAIPSQVLDFLENPENYTGAASEKAKEIASMARDTAQTLTA
ncbi:hypothetical protein C0580_01205 [Candidatus Parcubacteria bacterium]|nr:MAG: hypothetical protein C0580_01205 [Candidatus Parcubacteria bacterium]